MTIDFSRLIHTQARFNLEPFSSGIGTPYSLLFNTHHFAHYIIGNMQVDEPALASSSRRKTVHVVDPDYTDVTRQEPFNYRSLPSHDPAICIDAGTSTSCFSRAKY
jgi:hypothetical protein